MLAANTSEQYSNASSPLPTELTSPPPHHGRSSFTGDASPRGGHYLRASPAAPTPSSGNMTLSLDGYMEPTRLSITTPYLPLMQPITSPSEDSFPVFSPPPYPGAPRDRTIETSSRPLLSAHGIGPPWMRDLQQRRYSAPSISPSMSHHACNVYYPNSFLVSVCAFDYVGEIVHILACIAAVSLALLLEI